MRKKLKCVVIALLLLSNLSAQDEVIFKNMAADFQRNLNNDLRQFENHFVYTAIYSFSFSNDNFNRSLKKLNRKEDSLITNEAYLTRASLNYFFDFYSEDSAFTLYPEELKLFSQSMCNCLAAKNYTAIDSFKNNLFVYCIKSLGIDTLKNEKFKVLFKNSSYNNPYSFRRMNSFLSLAKHCSYYREFFISKVIEEADKKKKRGW